MRSHRRSSAAPRLGSLVVAVSLIVGCAGSANNQTGGAASKGDASDLSNITAAQLKGTTLQMSRFFGDCNDTTQGVTDVTKAKTECEVIQILTNAFNANNEFGIKVERLGGAVWNTYYDALNAAFASGNPPDVAVMHGSNLPDYAARKLLLPLDKPLAAAKLDIGDAAKPARDAVTYDGTTYAVPFDIHANLVHVNIDLFKAAGLVDAAGKAKLPTSVDEFFSEAKQIKDKTGKQFIGGDFVEGPNGVRVLMALANQQDIELVSGDGKTIKVDSPESRKALDVLLRSFNEGYANPKQTYDAAQQAFLRGDMALLINGTWVVNQYTSEATFAYQAADFPTLFKTPATWANSHIWAIPQQKSADPVKYRAGIEFMKYLYSHEDAWALSTGHLAARTSVLGSPEFTSAPQRANYAETAKSIAHEAPRVRNWQAVEDILKHQIEGTWLAGTPPDQALKEAQRQVEQQLAK